MAMNKDIFSLLLGGLPGLAPQAAAGGAFGALLGQGGGRQNRQGMGAISDTDAQMMGQRAPMAAPMGAGGGDGPDMEPDGDPDDGAPLDLSGARPDMMGAANGAGGPPLALPEEVRRMLEQHLREEQALQAGDGLQFHANRKKLVTGRYRF